MELGTFFSGFVTGASSALLLDPRSGHRRRALARDKLIHYNKLTGDYVAKAGRDLSNRVRGTIAEIKSGKLRADNNDRRRGHGLTNPAPGQVLAGFIFTGLLGAILGTAKILRGRSRSRSYAAEFEGSEIRAA